MVDWDTAGFFPFSLWDLITEMGLWLEELEALHHQKNLMPHNGRKKAAKCLMSHFSPFSFGPVCLALTAQYRLPFVLIVMSSRGKEWIAPSFFFLLEPQPS